MYVIQYKCTWTSICAVAGDLNDCSVIMVIMVIGVR